MQRLQRSRSHWPGTVPPPLTPHLNYRPRRKLKRRAPEVSKAQAGAGRRLPRARETAATRASRATIAIVATRMQRPVVRPRLQLGTRVPVVAGGLLGACGSRRRVPAATKTDNVALRSAPPLTCALHSYDDTTPHAHTDMPAVYTRAWRRSGVNVRAVLWQHVRVRHPVHALEQINTNKLVCVKWHYRV